MSFMQNIPRPVTTYRTETYERISKGHGFKGTGKTVLITGGSNGVGFSICKAFAEAGVARIAIVSRSKEEQNKAKAQLEAAYPDTQILTYPASITEYERVAHILKGLGSVDVVVLNAAIAHRRVEGKNLDTSEVQAAFDINTVAAFNITSAYLSDSTPKPAGGRKTVINISSAAVQFFGYRMGYGASKAAAVQMMQAFAAEHPGDDVRVFSFHPGSLYTPGVAQNWPKDAMQWDDINLPADFAVWLAGPESDFLNGRYMWANWDVDELIALKDRLAKEKNFLTIGLVL